MYRSSAYPAVTPAQIDQFVLENFHGKCIAVDPEGYPVVSLLPFQYYPSSDPNIPSRFDLHLVQDDTTFQALQSHPQCTFLIDQPLAFTPHDLVDPEYAGNATLHFRAAVFYCHAETITAPDQVAQVLDNLVHHYEPDKSFHPVTDTSYYHDDLSRLGIARLTVVRFEAKFKLAQGRSPEGKKALSQFLEQRNLPMDATALAEMRKAWANL
ncbi:MAG: hypothetical protein C7B46_06585 [Sulfobacillus benefaciens]|uniref:FMN-binding negative transcriptional regulator n=1 Tax=Sulfobacillus benefaciens TaxID=453960 RepID=A0A2T2XIC5_9FIRM|nr:MAG: hypothetical protein C7B46_06585 [Sulfobacillus benefaciens]